MKKIELSSIPTDRALPADLCDADGKVYARAGKIVAPYLLELTKVQEGRYVDEHWPDDTASPSIGSSTPQDCATRPGKGNDQAIVVRSLRAGTVLDQDIYDGYDVLQLRAGSTITRRFLEQLNARGIQPLTCKDEANSKSLTAKDPNAQPKLETTTTRKLDQAIEDFSHDAEMPTPRITPAVRLSLSHLREELEKDRLTYRGSVDCYAQLVADAIEGKVPDSDTAHGVIGRFFDVIGKDDSLDLFAMDIQTDPDERIFHHSVNVAILTMATARYMGFSEEHVLAAGLGAVLHDAGMRRVPLEVRMAPRELTPDEQLKMREHPIHLVNLLERIKGVTPITLLVAYQMHERCAGSGYPRGRHEMFIQPLGKIAGIADSYAAGCGWRPYRDARSPYQSIVEVILSKVRDGLFDVTAARAFLDSLSLFPVGSYVQLSSNVNAKVLRSNRGQHTRPVVVPLTDDAAETDQELDLSKTEDLRVIATLYGPDDSVEGTKKAG